MTIQFKLILLFTLAILAGCGGSSDNDLDDDGIVNAEDCAPLDETKWALQPYSFEDQDLDGWYIASVGELCAGNELPAEYRSEGVANYVADCDDQDSSVFRKIVIYMDEDGDGVGSGVGVITCMGNSYLEDGVSIYGYDPEPNNPEVKNFNLSPAILAAP